jgi:hypothetical protein
MVAVSQPTTKQAEADQACVDAVDLARRAADEDAGAGRVGPYEGYEAGPERVVTHLFACLDPAYVGWRWAVTVTRASRAKVVTVSESLLLPGPDSLLAPAWVPWTERVRPGDLKAGDLMPARADDERLTPVVALAAEAGLLDWEEGDAWRLGAGGQESGAGALRPARVLSPLGRDDTAVRWYASQRGPGSPLAKSAPAHCMTCGFLIPLSGPLGRVFGVCANELAPDDGKVVSVDHGCGAHSDGNMPAEADEAGGLAEPAVDELGYDLETSGAAVPDSVLETIDHELA